MDMSKVIGKSKVPTDLKFWQVAERMEILPNILLLGKRFFDRENANETMKKNVFDRYFNDKTYYTSDENILRFA